MTVRPVISIREIARVLIGNTNLRHCHLLPLPSHLRQALDTSWNLIWLEQKHKETSFFKKNKINPLSHSQRCPGQRCPGTPDRHSERWEWEMVAQRYLSLSCCAPRVPAANSRGCNLGGCAGSVHRVRAACPAWRIPAWGRTAEHWRGASSAFRCSPGSCWLCHWIHELLRSPVL